MKITQSKYKNVFALRLETEKYVALVLPSEGGKIASFQDKANSKEYLVQNPSPTYLHIGMTEDFEKGECSGFDDMFPTIDSVTVDGNDYPDHGEVCRVSFAYSIQSGKLVLSYRSKTFEYSYIKTFREGTDGNLSIVYAIKNVSKSDINVLWAAHCLVRAEQGGQVIVPFDEGEPVDLVYDGGENVKKRFSYQSEYLLSMWENDKPTCKKLYFPRACEKGYIAYRYPQGDEFVMQFDCQQLPYLGIWEDNGTINGSYCVGFEPCSLGYDTVLNAEKYGQKRLIKTGETMRFAISLYVK